MRLPATARCGTFACLLGEGDAESPLEKTLREEKAADQKLNQLSDAINPEAASGEVQEEQTESVRRPVGKRLHHAVRRTYWNLPRILGEILDRDTTLTGWRDEIGCPILILVFHPHRRCRRQISLRHCPRPNAGPKFEGPCEQPLAPVGPLQNLQFGVGAMPVSWAYHRSTFPQKEKTR
jgi:hypothetical protein